MRLSRVRPWLAPLTLAIGAFAMLFDGVKLLFTNWRLTLVQVLPAMWIWAAMYDLKLHVSPWRDKAFHVLTGPAVVIPIVLGIAAITAAGLLPERRVRVRDHPAPAARGSGRRSPRAPGRTWASFWILGSRRRHLPRPVRR